MKSGWTVMVGVDTPNAPVDSRNLPAGRPANRVGNAARVVAVALRARPPDLIPCGAMIRALCLVLLVLAGCARPAAEVHRLPTGVVLDPAGTSVALGSMPLTMR